MDHGRNVVMLIAHLQEEKEEKVEKEAEAVIPVEKEKVPVVRGRYYGRGTRDGGDDSESELSVDGDGDEDGGGDDDNIDDLINGYDTTTVVART